MKRLFALLLLIPSLQAATSYTEFFCYPASSDDSNLNSGSSTNAPLTYAGGTFVRGTGVFTVASGNPSSDGVTVGDFASIYTTAGATVATFIGRITARDTTTITVSLTAISGATSSVDEGAGAATCKVGGPWTGPNASVQFPFNFAAATMTNAVGNVARVNLQNDAAYTLNNSAGAINHTLAGPVVFQGFNATPGDLGKATINDTTTSASYVLITLAGANVALIDVIAYSAFTSGTSNGLTVSGAECFLLRVVVHDVRFHGIAMGASGAMVECEVYAANKANSSPGVAGISLSSSGAIALRCISHDNTGSNANGFVIGSSSSAVDCISDSNGGDGFYVSTTLGTYLIGCDSYANGGDGFDFTATSAMFLYMENCNAVKNGGWGINTSGSATLRNGLIANCGFPAAGGAQSNTSGNIATIEGVNVVGTVTYANTETPWTDPANGDFRITLTAAKNTGRGAFTQTSASYAGTIAYPDIGAAQHQSAAPGGTGGGSFTWAQ